MNDGQADEAGHEHRSVRQRLRDVWSWTLDVVRGFSWSRHLDPPQR